MIEVDEMAQLVHNDVVGKFRRQKRNAVIKIEISSQRAAAPTGAAVFDKYFAIGDTVERRKMGKPRVRKRTRGLLVAGKAGLRRFARLPSPAPPPDTPHL